MGIFSAFIQQLSARLRGLVGNSGENHVTAIDGLRGVAVLLVLFLHGVVMTCPKALVEWGRYWNELLYLAVYGVDIFFAISGFLIARILMGSQRTAQSVRTFYLRRIFRILPLYLLSATFLYALSVMISPSWFRIVPFWVYVFFVENLYMSPGYYPAPLLAVVWTLCIEEQFYLLAPWILIKMPAQYRTRLLWVVVLSGPLMRWGAMLWFPNINAAGFTPCRWDAIAIGMLAAQTSCGELRRYYRKLPEILIGMAVASFGIWAAFLTGDLEATAIGRAFLVTAAGVAASVTLLILVDEPDHWLKRRLRARGLVLLGRWCFSIYLWHIPIFLLAYALTRNSAASLLLTLGGVLVFAYFSWFYLENPLIRYSRKWKY